MKKILSYLLFAIGLVLIIVCFNYFSPEDTEQQTIILNIAVTSFIYFLFFIDGLFPMVNFGDKSQSSIGSIGIRWFVTILYSIFAIGLMFVFAFAWKAPYEARIIIHSVLAFLALLGLFSAVSSSGKVETVFEEELKSVNLLNDIKNNAKTLVDNSQLNSVITPEIKGHLLEFYEGLRFISPSNNPEALNIEKALVQELKHLDNALALNPQKTDNIMLLISKCKNLYKNRKSIYSI